MSLLSLQDRGSLDLNLKVGVYELYLLVLLDQEVVLFDLDLRRKVQHG